MSSTISGSGVEISFSEDWLMDMIRGKPAGKAKLKVAMRAAMLKAGKEMQRSFVSTLYSGRLKKRTGDLGKSFMKPGSLKIASSGGAVWIVFGTDDPSAWPLETGATITPKKGEWLAWPLEKYKLQRDYQGNSPARMFFQKFGKNALFVAPGGKHAGRRLKGGIYMKEGKGRLKKHFHVAKQTRVPRLLNFERNTNKFWKNKGMGIVEDTLMEKLGF